VKRNGEGEHRGRFATARHAFLKQPRNRVLAF
jgi:hypothetical protein